MEKDLLYIKRTFDLAENGRGKVSPNPMVGCVIVKNDKIISEGFHQIYGGPHAEVNAINAVNDKEQLKDATLYVNLEPCSHFGKTPPCADLIIQYPFERVVVCNSDPNPLVSGKGIEKIKSAGIKVSEGVLYEEGRKLNARFFTYMEKKRPYVILKWAETEDGFIAREDLTSKWISNDLSRKLVHKWRAEEDAIIVGANTVLCDNPRLNVRDWQGKNPLRVFIDNDLKVPSTFNLFDGSQPTVCYNKIKSEKSAGLEYVSLKEGRDGISFILEDLYSRKIQSLIVEGGRKLLTSFIDSGNWDEIRVFKSKNIFEKGIAAPEFKGRLIEEQGIDNDQLLIYKNPRE
ncbi:MAG: bifunctional diaminohydroxyphosphoribosylaminopyrimidine deaminase/5-amino-6-(5-phosphoribosylamino)uracil reductase RibD [Cytophagaceae bacterium]|nr:bifunctional diaminohydroxyphosphoribosylaminopyrimidine deaminase/5-amino-6-(5-phosphoribosylamino)uracil reductase RibD [Cytophagaceae bacterium]